MAQAITTKAQPIATQYNMKVFPQENYNAITMTSCMRDFTRVNPPMYFGSKVDEEPQDLLDEVNQILFFVGVSTTEKDQLAAYQIKDVA